MHSRGTSKLIGLDIPFILTMSLLLFGGLVGLQVRAMLAVPYFEKALYELPEDQLTPDTLLALADEIEVRLGTALCHSICRKSH